MTGADKLVVAFATLLVVYLYVVLWGGRGAGEDVEVLVNGRAVERVSLHRDQILTIHGAVGPSTIEVHAGRARFIASPCPGKQCVHSGWLHEAGEFAACLPNRISLHVLGAVPRYDTINF